MPDCQALSSHTQSTVLITKDNLYDLIPDTYSLSPDTTVTVSCVSGLRLVGASTFTCQSSGQWSYSSKPYCTDEPETPTDGTQALDETSKIIIGVVCGIAALIVIALIVMIVVIMYKDCRRRRECENLIKMWQKDRRNARDIRGVDGPSTIDMEMYSRYPRTLPPPPYDYGYRSLDRNIDHGSRLSNPVFLPGYGRQETRSHLRDEGKQGRRSKSYEDLVDSDTKPYVRDWVRRNSLVGSDEYLYNRPGLHGSRQSRDPFLWRQTNY